MAVFAEKGFFTSRIADIADRAAVADGTVYLYFKSKEEILMTAINTAFDAFMSLARTELKKQAIRPSACAGWHFFISTRSAPIATWLCVFQMELRQSTRFPLRVLAPSYG